MTKSISHYPHRCPKCASPAYIGVVPASGDCSNARCPAPADEPTERMGSWAQAAIKHAAAYLPYTGQTPGAYTGPTTLAYPTKRAGVSHIKAGDQYMSQTTGATYSVASVDDALDEVHLTIPGALGTLTVPAFNINDPLCWMPLVP